MRVCVIGGGVSGLSAAYRLRQRGIEVELHEASKRLGGLLGTVQIEHAVVETGADSILTEKPWALALARELGLESEIIHTRPERQGAYLVHAGRLARVPEGFSLIAPVDLAAFRRSPLLSRRAKARALLDLKLPPARDDDPSLQAFVERRFGRELFARIAQPLAGGIYGADPALLSLRATMPRFWELEQQYGSVIRGLRARVAGAREEAASGARYKLFAAFRGGMQTLVDALARSLAEVVHLGSPARGVTRTPSGFRVQLAEQTRTFDALLVATPAHRAAELLRELDPRLADALGLISYASAATVTLEWPLSAIAHPLDAYGFVVPAVERRGIIASTWANRKWSSRAPDDRALIRVFVGGHLGQHLVSREDDELVALARRELAALVGVHAEPTFTKVVRYVRAMPQYHVGHLQRVSSIERQELRHEGFALAGNAYRGVGIPDAIRSGELAAQRLLERWAPTS